MLSRKRHTVVHESGELAGVLDWVDTRFGPITELAAIPLGPPEPRWWVYSIALARSPVGSWSSPYHIGAAGASIDPDEALQRALGEAVERYSAFDSAHSVTPIQECLTFPRDRLPLCAPFEQSNSGLEEEGSDPFGLAAVRKLSDDSEVLLPFSLVHLSLPPPVRKARIVLPMSTGLAFSTVWDTAIWRGICEVAERDALMLAWWLRRSVPEIDTGTEIPESVRARTTRLRAVSLTPRLFDMTTDGILAPAVLCVLTSSDYPYATVGAGCHEDPDRACAKALDEAVSIRVSLRWDKWEREIPSTSTFDWVERLEHHMLLYAGWEGSPALDFLLRGRNQTVPYAAFAARYRACPPRTRRELVEFARNLESEGLTVCWADVTAPEARRFGTTVKVVIPEMLPMSDAHSTRYLATPRLLDLANLDVPDQACFNPYPHPFA